LAVAARKIYGNENYSDIPAYKPDIKQRASRKTTRTSNYGIVFGVFVVMIVFSVALSYTFIQAMEAKIYFEISKTERNNQEIAMQNEKIKLDIAKLESLDRIENIAIATMGMTKTPEIQYLAMQNVSEKPDDTNSTSALVSAKVGADENLSAGKKIIAGIVTVLKGKNPG